MSGSTPTVNVQSSESPCKDPVWPSVLHVDDFLTNVRNEANGGYCYLWLLFGIEMLSSFDPDRFRRIVAEFKEIGKDADGSKIVSKFLDISAKIVQEEGYLKPLESSIWGTGCFRFKITAHDPVMHLDVTSIFGCECKGSVCRHGWSFNAILCYITRPDVKMGSEFNVDAFFDEPLLMTREEVMTAPLKVGKPDFSDSGIYKNKWLRQIREANIQLGLTTREEANAAGERQWEFERDMEVKKALEDKLNDQLKKNEEAAQKLIFEKNTEGQTQQQQLRCEVAELRSRLKAAVEASVVEEIGPDDSSSVFSRYGKKYMPRTNSFSGEKPLSDLIEEETALACCPPESMKPAWEAVTSGFKLQPIQFLGATSPIFGLARPFKNNRLNFLANLYSVMKKLLIEGEDGFVSNLWNCADLDAQTPSEELLREVLFRTFNKKNYRVSGNPYELPYIEVGMDMTESNIIKCFELLELEYRTLWFTELREIEIPSFHDRYRGHSTKSRSSGGRSNSESSSKGSRRSSKDLGSKKASSHLSFGSRS